MTFLVLSHTARTMARLEILVEGKQVLGLQGLHAIPFEP